MAELSYSCSVRQGFNFEKDAQILVGHINSLTVGGEPITADIEVTDPLNVTARVKVVGVVSMISWEGGYADPVQFSCQVSLANKQKLSLLTHTKMSDTSVSYKFTTHDYDPVLKKYYKCFWAEADLTGLVQKSGGSLNLYISADQSMEVVSPKNFTLSIGIMPTEDKAQEIHAAVSEPAKFVKQWGVAVG